MRIHGLRLGNIPHHIPISFHTPEIVRGTMDVGRIPVVARDDPTRLLGVLRRHDIIKVYNKAADEARRRGLT